MLQLYLLELGGNEGDMCELRQEIRREEVEGSDGREALRTSQKLEDVVLAVGAFDEVHRQMCLRPLRRVIGGDVGFEAISREELTKRLQLRGRDLIGTTGQGELIADSWHHLLLLLGVWLIAVLLLTGGESEAKC